MLATLEQFLFLKQAYECIHLEMFCGDCSVITQIYGGIQDPNILLCPAHGYCFIKVTPWIQGEESSATTLPSLICAKLSQ